MAAKIDNLRETILSFNFTMLYLTNRHAPHLFFVAFLAFSHCCFCQNIPKLTPADSIRTARQVDSLLNTYASFLGKHDFENATKLLNMAEKIVLEKLGQESGAFGRYCNSRGALHHVKGEYAEAEKYYLQSLPIQEKFLGKEQTTYANCLNNLGGLYRVQGNFKKAEPLYLEAKAIREKVLGKEHPSYTASINSIGNLYMSMRIYEKAEPFFIEAIAVKEKILGKEHPDYAMSLNNLGLLYKEINKYEKAELLLLEAKAIREKTLGKEHADYGASLANLGNLYHQTGAFGKAEPLLLENLSIQEKTFGREHPEYVKGLLNLGALYQGLSMYPKAISYYLEALPILQKTLGTKNPEYARALKNLTMTYEHQNQPGKSEQALEECLTLAKDELILATSFLSEEELGKYKVEFYAIGDYVSSFLTVRQLKNKAEGTLPSLAYDHILFHKGFSMMAAARLHRPVSSSPEASEIELRLKNCRSRLAAEYAKPVAEQEGVADIEAQANAAEKELARTVAGYAENARQVHWQDVKSALRPGEAAIEFVHYKVIFPVGTDSVRYAALLLTPQTEQPVFVPLSDATALNALLQSSGARKSDYVNRLYGATDLYQKIWQPLERTLVGVKKVYFAPTGLIHRLNLAAIPMSKTEVLGDRFRFVQLGSTRQLVVKQPSAPNAEHTSALYGGIRFDMDEKAIATANANLSGRGTDGSRGEMDFSKTDSTDRGGDWAFLNYTEKEVEVIQPILAAAGQKTALYEGFAATEESFKALGTVGNGTTSGQMATRSPRILHLATHGYFFPDPKSSVPTTFMGMKGEPTFKISEHPMIRSGLILAGGNHAWKNGLPLKPDMEDGVLTAYEIAQMDLSGTELVVLSACETGLGDIVGGEGVYGLQRAFKIAGAKYLIMSLWQVPDFQTQELMTTFYKFYLTKKMPLPEAFRLAQSEMRQKYEHPYFWAGFVLLE